MASLAPSIDKIVMGDEARFQYDKEVATSVHGMKPRMSQSPRQSASATKVMMSIDFIKANTIATISLESS